MGFFSKSSYKNNDNDKDKWKDKCLDLLDTQEQTEKAHKVEQELLCKTIVRLSFAASGVDPQLEPYLERIRSHIKNGVDSAKLKTELEKFTDALSRLKSASPTVQQDNDGDVALLFDFLLHHYTSEKHQQNLNLLKKSCQSLALDDPNRLFTAIAKIINVEEAKPVDNPPDEVPNEENQAFQHLIDPAFVSAQLVQLLEHIEIPETSIQKAQAIKQQLASQEAALSFESTMDNVIALLIEINANNQPKQLDIDKFLNHITAQLTELGLAVTDSGIALMDASLSRSKLDQSVSEQMSDLQNQSSNATQLEPLRQAITSHISQITKEIQEHKQKEAVQREKYQHQLEELGQKIKAMESETGELQTKLIVANTNALRDTLTDLPNRLAYDERLKMEIARWQRYHTPLCLVVWDVDYFKKVNDQYGHQVGDKVLVHVAGLFSSHIRRADFIARFGGEEFVMLLPHTNKHSALKVAEKLRSIIEQSPLTVNDITLSVTISGGITQLFKGDTHETAFEKADQALYRAKELGRNQCYTL